MNTRGPSPARPAARCGLGKVLKDRAAAGSIHRRLQGLGGFRRGGGEADLAGNVGQEAGRQRLRRSSKSEGGCVPLLSPAALRDKSGGHVARAPYPH